MFLPFHISRAPLGSREDRSLTLAGTLSGSTYLLGKIHDEPAILLIQRTQIAGDAAPGIVQGGLASLNVFLENKPVS